MRVRLTGIVLLLSLLAAGSLAAASRPPLELHLVGDHWTGGRPATAQACNGRYTIVRGDPLWALAKRCCGNLYRWPQLWEKMQFIVDARGFYPGGPRVAGIKVAPV